MASGLLPIALGDASKMIPYMDGDNKKEYLFSVQFGFETDTLDITGKTTENAGVLPEIPEIMRACVKLTGQIEQIPPQYSAIHVDGRRAYEMARAGKVFDMKPRSVHIYELEMLGFDEKSANFRVVCSTGTYVRSLGRDIAKLCGTLGTVDMIRRTRTNGFYIKDAVKLDFLENLYNNGGACQEYLQAVDFGLGDIPVWNLDETDANVFMHGGFITSCKEPKTSSLWRVYQSKPYRFLGIGINDEAGVLKPKRVL